MLARFRLLPLVLGVLIVPACGGGDGREMAVPPAPSTTAAPPATVAPSTTTTQPPDCEGIRGVPPGGEVTYVGDGGLFAVDPATGEVRCLVAGVDAVPEWGPTGDRMLVGDEVVLAGADGVDEAPGAPDRTVELPVGIHSFSRPTGTSVLEVTPDGGLRKRSLADGTVTELSFLARHDEAVYHPAGQHIVVAGESAGGARGLFLADNLGRNHRLITENETADRLFDLHFDGRGGLWFQAQHGRELHIHVLQLGSGTLTTERQGPGELSALAVSPFGDGTAWYEGPCGSGRLMVRGDVGRAAEVADARGTPVGWLPDGTLITHDTGCDRTGDLLAVEVEFASTGLATGRGATRVLVPSVGAAAVRAPLPEPPPPPSEVPAGEAPA